MINNIIIQFIEEIKKNIKFFEGNSDFEKIQKKLKEISEIIPFNKISDDKTILFFYKDKNIYKLFYQYKELETIKEELKKQLNQNNNESIKEKLEKLKALFHFIKSERNGTLINNKIKFYKSFNFYNLFIVFQYKINTKVEKITTLKEFMNENPDKINESFVTHISKQIANLLEECNSKKLVLFNLSINSIFFVNENYSNIYFNDFSKSKYLYKKGYEYQGNCYTKRELFKIDIFALGKLMYTLLSKDEDETNIYHKISYLKNISQKMELLILKMIEPDVIFRYNIYQVINSLNSFKTIINNNLPINNDSDSNFINKKRDRIKSNNLD